MRNLHSVLMGASLVLAGCASVPPPVLPPQSTEITTDGKGIPAAVYDLRGPDVAARVVVWSEGVYPDGATYVHFAADVTNLGEVPLAVDLHELRAEPLDAAGRPLPGRVLALEEHSGANVRHVATLETRRFDFFFTMPRDVEPGSIGKLYVRWGLLGSSGERLVRTTELVADEARSSGVTRAFTPVSEEAARLMVMPARRFPRHQ